MSCRGFLIGLALLSGGVLQATYASDPQQVESRMVSVGLFKNGFAVVKREIAIPADGVFRVLDIPQPVHGTLWVESDAELETRVTHAEFERERSLRVLDFQKDLAGQEVTIHFYRSDQLPLRGVVVDFGKSSKSNWSRNYERPRWSPWWGGSVQPHVSPVPSKRYVVLDQPESLDQAEGRIHVDQGQIMRIDTAVQSIKVVERRPVLEFNARKVPAAGGTIRVFYLTKGIAWAPSYRVELAAEDDNASGDMSVSQKAVIRNEFGDLNEVEIELISGFPSIELSHVLSPLSVETTWANFFTQLSQQMPGGSGASAITQQGVAYNSLPQGAAGANPILPAAEGVDVYYRSIGRRSLLEGDSLLLTVGQAQGRYESIVDWIIADTRGPDGRTKEEWRRHQAGETSDDAWDAVRFSNPFDFPMTTAPATIISDGRFRGQRTSHWVNPGERTTLRITKALSIRTLAVENEEPNAREVIKVGVRDFRRTDVKGTVTVCNHRKKAVVMVIQRRFSGDLIEADGSPVTSLREEGVYSINQRNQLEWTVTVAPGEELNLSYRYRVLVRH